MSKKKIKIGVPTALYGETFGINAKYLNWVSQFGQPLLLTPGISQMNNVDALFLPGGADVSNNLTFLNTRANPHLDSFDKEELPNYIEKNKPIFGVCRGMQAINVHFGGTLRNLIGNELKVHQRNYNENEKNSLVHSLRINSNSPIEFEKSNFLEPSDTKFMHVNSIHHQCIDVLGKNLKIIANSYEEIPECIIHETKPIAGVQWHPEKINDEFSKQLFKHILQ